MSFMDDIKSDQRTQILVSGMIFFAIIFPMYFSYAAGSTDVSYTIGGPVGNYSVEGTYSYHTLGEGTVSVADGESESFTVNTDMVSSEIEGKNIVGVRAILTFEDNEQAPAGCSTAEDDVTGHLMHEDLHMTETVQSGSVISIEWHDSSLVNTNVSNMSESDIEAMLDNTEMIGYGEQFLEITVDVNKGSCNPPFPPRETNDDGEDVTYTWELISLEYEISAID